MAGGIINPPQMGPFTQIKLRCHRDVKLLEEFLHANFPLCANLEMFKLSICHRMCQARGPCFQ